MRTPLHALLLIAVSLALIGCPESPSLDEVMAEDAPEGSGDIQSADGGVTVTLVSPPDEDAGAVDLAPPPNEDADVGVLAPADADDLCEPIGCIEPYPACAVIGGMAFCVSCASDSDCEGGCICDAELYACVDAAGQPCGACPACNPSCADAGCFDVAGLDEACDLDSGLCFDPLGTCDGVALRCPIPGSACESPLELLFPERPGLPGGLMDHRCTCSLPPLEGPVPAGAVGCMPGLTCAPITLLCSGFLPCEPPPEIEGLGMCVPEELWAR